MQSLLYVIPTLLFQLIFQVKVFISLKRVLKRYFLLHYTFNTNVALGYTSLLQYSLYFDIFLCTFFFFGSISLVLHFYPNSAPLSLPFYTSFFICLCLSLLTFSSSLPLPHAFLSQFLPSVFRNSGQQWNSTLCHSPASKI